MSSISRQIANNVKQWIEENYLDNIEDCVTEKLLLEGNKQSPKADIGIKKKNGEIIAVEIEIGQTHPDTNVSKYWRMKYRFTKGKKLTLIQVFGPRYENDYQSRTDLAEFIAKRMIQDYGKTFEYVRQERPFSGDGWERSMEDFIKEEIRKVIE